MVKRRANICLLKKNPATAEHGQAPDHSLQLRSLEARLGKVARSGGMHGDMIRVLAGESEERHAVAMRLQRTLAQECQGAAQRQERLAAELAAAQRSIAQLQGNTSAAPAQARHWPNIPPSTVHRPDRLFYMRQQSHGSHGAVRHSCCSVRRSCRQPWRCCRGSR